jgi:hypothetical protein
MFSVNISIHSYKLLCTGRTITQPLSEVTVPILCCWYSNKAQIVQPDNSLRNTQRVCKE